MRIYSAYDNVRTSDNFRSILPRVRSINACPVTMSERRRAPDELQTNAFIASDEIVSATHLRIRFHIADECVLCWRRTNPFGAGDERVLRWRQTNLFAPEMNAFHAGDGTLYCWNERVENTHSNFSYTNTRLATSYSKQNLYQDDR